MPKHARILLVAVPMLLLVAASPTATEVFVWKRGAKVIGRLRIPIGEQIEVYDYLEGIVTTLRYPDGAYLKLQSGGMFRLPLFSEPEYKLVSSRELDMKTTRAGSCGAGKLNWREDNYKAKKSVGKLRPSLFAWPPNIGYANVTPARKVEFDHALDSFVLEADRVQ